MRLRRLGTLLAAILGLQFALVGWRPACPAAHDISESAGAGGAGRAMPGMMMAMVGQATSAPTSSPVKLPCDESGAPRACQTTASCATAFAAPPVQRAPTAACAVGVPALTVLAPPSLAFLPELPPPRA